jgi:cytochrome oxidase Cu insertion factor (SCO1/SenC/PrrC family)
VLALGALAALTSVGHAAAVQIGGPFELVDQHGATRTDADFRGSYLLIHFGFTYCPDFCPTTLLKMADALEELAVLSPAKAERVVPTFISVDPERDTPETLRGYAEQFNPRLVALTGTPKALAKVGRRYGVFSAKVPTGEPGGYVVDHTSFLYLIGPDGKYVQHFESNVSVDDLVGALERSVVAPAAGGS